MSAKSSNHYDVYRQAEVGEKEIGQYFESDQFRVVICCNNRQ